MSGGFADLGLLPELLQAIDDLGWQLPTDIQDEAIPLILGGGDVMGAAETGSGKTAAFALPVIQSVYERLKGQPSSNVARKRSRSETEKDVPIRLNANDRDSQVSVSENGYSCTHSGNTSQWAGVRGSHGVNQGKYYFECKATSKGNCRVGWATMSAHLELGKDAYGFGYGGKGWKSNNGGFDKYGGEYTEGDYVGVYLDLDLQEVVYSKNGHLLDIAYKLPENLKGAVFFPAFALSGGSYEVNFGHAAFRYPPVKGFEAISKATSEHIFDTDAMESYTIAGSRLPLAIIIEPTRDLAEQVYQSVQELSRHLKTPSLKTLLVIGDDNRNVNVKQELQRGVDIVIGTIGKIVGCIESKQLDLSQIRFFVLDEADKLTTADNIASIKQIYGKCPGGGSGYNRLQVCFFSATLHSPSIRELAELVCINPTWIDLKGQETVMPDTLHHVLLPVLPSQHYAQILPKPYNKAKHGLVLDEVHVSNENGDVTKNQRSQQIKEMKPFLAKQLIDKFQMSQVMIFCRTNLDCMNLEKFFLQQNLLQENVKKGLEDKYTCKILGGLLTMEDRRRNLQAFKDAEVRILICTDVAARGIDIHGLPYVINMTLPDEAEDYVHRIGRVGRSDRMGLAMSLVAMEDLEKVWYHRCNKRGGVGCNNREIVDKGGCTIWYNESQCLQKIEAKIQMPIKSMISSSNAEQGIDWSLPEDIAKMNVIYGEVATDSMLHKDKHHKVYMTDHMLEEVRQLVDLETQAQNIFLTISQLLVNNNK